MHNPPQREIWQQSTQHPTLAKNRVHLWRTNLDLPAAEVSRLTAYLSADEIDKANKFHFDRHRSRFIVARSSLRQLLGKYLHTSPNLIKFEYGDRGKPYLNADSNNCLEFNLSHSQDYALYGFTYNYPIGVDLEYLREMKDAAKIARRFFSPQEFQLLDCLKSEQQQQVFFKLWTAKEAYLKATGTGLADSLTSVDIGLERAEPYLKAIQGSVRELRHWSMYPCVPAQNYVGAIAIKAQITPEQVSYWNWRS